MYKLKNSPPEISRFRSFLDSLKMIKNPIAVFNKYSSVHGNTFVFYFGGIKKTIVSSHPAFIQHVLQKNHHNYYKSEITVKSIGHFFGNGLVVLNGKNWVKQRRLIQPGFHKARLAELILEMNEVLDESIERFETGMWDGPVDIYPKLIRLAFQITARSFFGFNLEEKEFDTLSNSIIKIQQFVVKQIIMPYLNPFFLISGEISRNEKKKVLLDDVILKYIRERRKSGGRHNDLLQMLMDSGYEGAGSGMSDEELLTESIGILIAGHETASTSLSWTLYLLCRHRDCLERIRREVKTEIGDGPLTYQAVPRLGFTVQVIEESMRLYPSIWLVDRVALENDQVLGFDIPRGSTVASYIYGVHHSPDYWADAEKFNPERFDKENKSRHVAFTHVPFGGGPRVCLGANFAMIEMLIILIKIIRTYDFELAVEKKVEIQPEVILRPKGGIRIKFNKRSKENNS
jgi:cytochrome P450